LLPLLVISQKQMLQIASRRRPKGDRHRNAAVLLLHARALLLGLQERRSGPALRPVSNCLAMAKTLLTLDL
jgi:hypothetical protein